MKIDTEIRHVTKPEANLFLELRFPSQEAKHLNATSKKRIKEAVRQSMQVRKTRS